MIGLQSGNYLGKVDKILFADGIVASITSYPDTCYSENLHYHETLHMSLVLSGGNLEKRNRTDIERMPGVVTFYDSGEPHCSTKTIQFSKHVNIEIENEFLQKNEIDIKAMDLLFLKSPDARFCMLKLLKELLTDDEFSKNAIQHLMINLLTASSLQNKYRSMPFWLNIVYEFLQDNWSENITLANLSIAANVHPVTISKYFPNYFGCTIGEYMRKLKVEKALALIESSSSSLTQISHECGFADQSHFIRTFKKETGFLPKHYRKLY
jgi:AraC family transcriptional regulator